MAFDNSVIICFKIKLSILQLLFPNRLFRRDRWHYSRRRRRRYLLILDYYFLRCRRLRDRPTVKSKKYDLDYGRHPSHRLL
jgi:hypothetical protein